MSDMNEQLKKEVQSEVQAKFVERVEKRDDITPEIKDRLDTLTNEVIDNSIEKNSITEKEYITRQYSAGKEQLSADIIDTGIENLSKKVEDISKEIEKDFYDGLRKKIYDGSVNIQQRDFLISVVADYQRGKTAGQMKNDIISGEYGGLAQWIFNQEGAAVSV